MARDDHVDEVMTRWQEERDQGRAVDPESLFREHPDIADELRGRVEALQLVDLAIAGAPELPTGTPREIGDFRLLREIGRGGMGVVYEARQVSMHRRVALKVLSAAITGAPHAVKRFQREARAAGRLHHTNIVPIYAMGQYVGHWYYAMELVEGRPLNDVVTQLRAARRPTEQRLARVAQREDPPSTTIPELETDTGTRSYFIRVAEAFAGIADALQLAHDEGITHRDIKPSNLLLDADGTIKLVDFGLALTTDAGGPAMTMTGDLLGTPAYMSPEQAMAKRVVIDHRTDIYSLGATLYEVLTLSPPFEGDNLHSICSQIISKDPALPRRRNKRIPRDLETIVLKAMEKDRDKRYRTAGEFARDLRRFAEGGAVHARRIGVAGRSWRRVKRHRVRAGLAATILILGSLAAGFWWHGAREARLRRESEYEHLVLRAESQMGVRGNEVAARSALDDAIRLLPDRPEAHWLRVLDPYRPLAQRFDDVETALRHRLPRGAYHLARARFFRLKGDAKASEREAAYAVAHQGNNPIESYFEARLASAIGERNRAIACLTRAFANTKDSSLVRRLAHRFRGELRFRAGEFARSLEDFYKLPEEPGIAVWIAAAWHRKGEEQIAEEMFADALHAAGDAASWASLCDACRRIAPGGLFAWYERATAAAFKAHPNHPLILTARAEVLGKLGHWSEALPLAELAAAAPHKSHRSLVELGFIHWRLANTDAAIAALDEGIRLDPGCDCGYGFKGRVLAEMERWADMLEVVESGAALHPGSWQLLAYKGLAHKNLRQPDEALAAYDRALLAAAGNPAFLAEIHLYRGRLLSDLGTNPEEALRSLNYTLKHSEVAQRTDRMDDPARVMTQIGRASSLLALGRFAEARQACEDALRLDPKKAGALVLHGESLHRSGNKGRALTEIEKALKIEEESKGSMSPATLWFAHYYRGHLLCDLGKRPTDALASFNHVLKSSESYRLTKPGPTHLARGRVLMRLSRVPGALESYKRAYDSLPDNAEVLYGIGLCHMWLRRRDKAMEWYQRAIDADARVLKAYINLAHLLASSGKIPEALRVLDDALKVDSTMTIAHAQQAALLNRLGKFDDALIAADAALAVDLEVARVQAAKHGFSDPGMRETAYSNRAQANFALKKSADAWDALEDAIRFGYRDANWINNLAWARATSRDPAIRAPERAVGIARRAQQLAPRNPNVLGTLGVALCRNRDWPEGANVLRQSLEIQAHAARYFFLAMAEQALQRDGARAWYDKGIAWMKKHRPGDEELESFRAEAAKALGIEAAKDS